ncbi:hypothetical protein HDU93_002759 [Gonapodya sp. JEL0774]|nr:hypothetical protein HDU93_002759 [Gonapodya sp. JEL0774]
MLMTAPAILAAAQRRPHFMDHTRFHYFAVELKGWQWLHERVCHQHASELAIELGMANKGPVGDLRGFYLFEVSKDAPSVGLEHRNHAVLSKRLGDHPKVVYHSRQVPSRRLFKRSIYTPDDAGRIWEKDLSILDPGATMQWHWYNRMTPANDVNITGVWMQAVTGKNVTVSIVDDGLDYKHPDLTQNFYLEGSWDFNGDKEGRNQGMYPTPYLFDDRHGTRCAGEVAAEKNSVCGVGAAWNARVSGIRILSADITEVDEATAITYGYQQNHIYSCSWGPADDGSSAEGPPEIVAKAFEEGIRNGRGGLGSIYVFATGNGGGFKDNCNYDGYTNSIWTLTIGAIDRHNEHPTYSEMCTAQMAVTYSSSGHGDSFIYTTDRMGTDGNEQCTNSHGGTSAAAPLASGILALVLSVRPDLSWRDVQRLVMETAVPIKLDDESWTHTAAKRLYSVKFGYGKLDAYALVERARLWKSVGPQTMHRANLEIRKVIPEGGMSLNSTIGVTTKIVKEIHMIHLEHVTVTVNIEHSRRGELDITLTSPSGIVSELGPPRPSDFNTDGLQNWTFSTVKHWDEDPVGLWVLSVRDTVDSNGDSGSNHTGQILDWTLTIWGESDLLTIPSPPASAPPPPPPLLTTSTTTPTPASSTNLSDQPGDIAPKPSHLSPGAIFGVTLLVGLVLVGGVLIYRWYRRRRRNTDLYQFQVLGSADPELDGAFFNEDFDEDFGSRPQDLDDFLDGVVASGTDKLRLYYALRAAVDASAPDKRSVDLGLPKDRDNRPSCLAFVDHLEAALRGRYLWVGTENGDLAVVDTTTSNRGETVVDRRMRNSTSGVNRFAALGQIEIEGFPIKGMYGIWEAGQITIFIPDPPHEPPRASGKVRSYRGLANVKHACASGTDLWCASEQGILEVYRPPPDDADGYAISEKQRQQLNIQQAPVQFKLDRLKLPPGLTGAVDGVAAAVSMGLVITAHRSQTMGGVLCAWDARSRTALRFVRVCQGWCTAMCVPTNSDRLWVAGADKRVYVLRLHSEVEKDWEAEKVWEAEGGEVRSLVADETCSGDSMGEKKSLPVAPAVAAVCGDGLVRVWDGDCTLDSVDKALRQREPLFASYSNIRVWVGSFNLDAVRPGELDSASEGRFVEAWVRDHLPPDWGGYPPDIAVFGLQEVVNLSNTSVAAKKFFQGTKRGIHEDEGGGKYRGWQDKFSTALRAVWPEEGFEAVDGTGLVGLFLCIFVRRAVKNKVSEVSVDSTKTGMAGNHGNKGAIAVRLLFEDSSLAFCNSHLAAHAENTAARLKNVVSIVRESEFPLPGGRGNGQDTGGIAVSFIGGGDGTGLMDHENVFFFGDLNFRISPDIAVPGDPHPFSRERCEDLIRAREWGPLLLRDQLDRERRQPPMIESPLRFFDEGELNFAPTFKYDVGSDVYDTSEKRRMPSWCDRLEELMGAEALGRTPQNINFDDPKVCRDFLGGMCIHDLFTNTKSDLGPCPKLHADKYKSQYEAALKNETNPHPGFDHEHLRSLEAFIGDCDRRIHQSRQKLLQVSGEDPRAVELMRAAIEITEAVENLVAEVQRAGEASDISRCVSLLEEIDRLKKEKMEKDAELRAINRGPISQQSKLRVCDACGAHLSVYDSDRRLADHFGGKLHIGYVRLRERVDELRKKLGTSAPQDRAGGYVDRDHAGGGGEERRWEGGPGGYRGGGGWGGGRGRGWGGGERGGFYRGGRGNRGGGYRMVPEWTNKLDAVLAMKLAQFVVLEREGTSGGRSPVGAQSLRVTPLFSTSHHLLCAQPLDQDHAMPHPDALPQSPPHSGDMETDAITEATPVNLNYLDSGVPSPMDSAPMEVSEMDGDMGSPRGTSMQIVPKEPTVSDLLPDASHFYEESDILGEGSYRFDIVNFTDMRSGAERQYSPEFEIAGHTWRLLIFPRGNRQSEFLSVFIESIDAKKPVEEITERWHACVHFALAVANTNDPTCYVHNAAHHRFTIKESDWGFNQLIRFSELAQTRSAEHGNVPIFQNNGFTITAFVRVVKDVTGVLWWNDLTDYDSKKETGYVGLKNQGATCYMNSLLQSLYFTNYFRKMVYQIPTDNDTPANSIPLALQRVFYNLQISASPPDTRELTRSFGWTTLDAFMQHDVQEFNRVLQDNLETKMKGTKAEGAISKIFGGKFKSYIRCVNVDYESSRVEDFNDIQLVVKGIKTLKESFDNYVAVEMMDGDNKYAAEGYGLQDAKKGISFVEFPQVLHLQLRRFEYDFQRDSMVKINDRFEFPPEIDLVDYLDEGADRTQKWNYICVGVLVHAGDTHGGHYYAMIKPSKDGRWLKFDDDKVVPVTEREVYEENFGGESPHRLPGSKPGFKRFVNAYMLVYMRETSMDDLLSHVTEEDIPRHLVQKIEEEREEAERERKEKEELHLFMNVKVLTNAVIKKHSGFDLWNWDEKSTKLLAPTYKVRKDETFAGFKKRLSEENNIPLLKMRIWSMAGRQNKTIRPDAPIPDSEDERIEMEQLKERYARLGDWRLYVEESELENRTPEGKVWDYDVFFGRQRAPNIIFVQILFFLPKEDSNPSQSILIFIKYYDPFYRKMEFAHSLVVRNRNTKLGDVIPIITERLALSKDTPLRLYEEVKPGMIDLLKVKNTFQQSELGDGDILIAMKDLTETELQQLPPDTFPDPIQYFEWYTYRTIVQFKPRETDPKPEAPLPEFELELSKKTQYDDVAKKVAQQIGLSDFLRLRFSLAPTASVAPRNLIKRTPTTTLHEMLQNGYHSPLTLCLYYEILDVQITELDIKRSLKVAFVDYRNKEVGQHDLLVPKSSTVEQLLEMLRPKLKLDGEHGTGKLRLFSTLGGRMIIYPPSDELVKIPEATFALYAEEIPVEEADHRDERVINVFHIVKEPGRFHGIPFRIVLEPTERWSNIKRKIQERLALPEKEWAKFKVYFCGAYAQRPSIVEDDDILVERELRDGDYIGLDHPVARPVRGFAFEKAIKIFG